ncbi:MAG: ABC transporter permease, partial [bacterium]|nr:ABC transporter permease [bacterium]
MTAYIIRRLVYTIPIVTGVLLLTFFLFNVAGGDLSIEIAGKNADAETIAEIRHEYGWDKPLLLAWDSQFIDHFKKALTFRFGRARDRELVIDKIKRGIGPSLALTIPMFFGVVVISVSLALIVAFVRGTVWDTGIVLICVAGMSLPYLSFILFGLYFPAFKWGWFPVYYSPEMSPAQYIALPVLIGIAAGLGSSLRFYR